MNINDPIFFTIHFLSFFVQFILLNYLYLHFLQPYHNQYKTIIYSFLIYLIFAFIAGFVIYEIPLLRSFNAIVDFEIIAILLYKDNISKKIIAGILMLFFEFAADIIAQLTLIIFFGNTNFFNLSYGMLFFCLLYGNLIIYIFIELFLQIFNKNISFQTKYHQLFIALSLFICLLTFTVLYSIIFNQIITISPFSFTAKNILIILITDIICCLICLIYIYKSIRKLHKNITKEMLIQSLHNFYLTQINDLLKLKNNDEQIKYLRHDIMNYLQTIDIYNQKEAQTHENHL